MTQLLPNIFAVEVPEDVDGFEISIQPDELPCVTYWSGDNIEPTVKSLPPGSYEMLFTTKDCTEEQAATLPMEDSGTNFGYKDYEGKQSSHFYADHALLSLLRSKDLDPKKNYLLLKKTS